jgi:hypothetical protein
MHARFWWENTREGNHLEDPRIDGKVILKRIFDRWGGGGHKLHRAGSEDGQVTESCECSNEPPGSIKRGGFLDKLRTC